MAIKQVEQQIKSLTKPISFDWLDNPSIKNLLDVIVLILSEEYTQIAKDNPEIFSNQRGQE